MEEQERKIFDLQARCNELEYEIVKLQEVSRVEMCKFCIIENPEGADPSKRRLLQRIRALEAYATTLEDGNMEMIAKIALLERTIEELNEQRKSSEA